MRVFWVGETTISKSSNLSFPFLLLHIYLPIPSNLLPLAVAAPTVALRHGVLLVAGGGDRRLHGPRARRLLHHPRPHGLRLPPPLRLLRLPRRWSRRQEVAGAADSLDGGGARAAAWACSAGGHYVGGAKGVWRIRPQEAPADGDQGRGLRRLDREVHFLMPIFFFSHFHMLLILPFFFLFILTHRKLESISQYIYIEIFKMRYYSNCVAH